MSVNNLDDMERPLMDVLREAGLVDQSLNLIDKKIDTIDKKAEQTASTFKAIQKQQAADAAVLAKSLSRVQNEESKTRVENLKQQNSLERINAKATADQILETQKQNGRLELENAKALARGKELAAKEAARVKTAADKAATDAIKHQNQLELENIRQQYRLELEHKKAEKNAAKDAAKAAAQAAKNKEKAEKDAAKAAAQAEKDAAKKAEEAAKTKKEAWQIVGNAIKKVADIVKNSLSKALSLVKKDIQLTVSLVKKGVDLFKSAGNTILRVLNLFGNFGDRLRSLFSGGIINAVLKGFNGLLNTVADVPNKILDNRFVQVGESLLSSIQSLNILIGKDLTDSTIAWANELERGFGLSADGLIADMRGVAGVLKGLGMDGGDTATASKNLAIMSRSFSVMLGYKPEEAMSKIESGMKGMTASVDDLGISVREAEMNSFLKDLKARGGEFSGIATSFSNLNEEQRVYVRYAAMIDQYLKAFSIEKYAKSLDTITGRLSILRERTRAFMSVVGNLFLQLFNKIVVPLTYAIDAITQKIKALTSFLGLSSELSANMNGMTDDVGTTIDTSGSVKELGKEAKALDDVSKAAKEAKGGMDSFDHITSMRSSSASSGSNSGDGAEGSDFDYSKLMDLNADDLAKRMEEMSKTMEDHTNSYKNKVKEGLTKIREAIDTWYTGQTGSKINWNKIFNLDDFKKATNGMGKNIVRAGKAIKDTFGVLLIKFAQDININRVLSKSLGLVNEALGALADILVFLKPILIELYDEIISPIVQDLGDKLAKSLDGAKAKLKQFRDDLKSGKYNNIKIVIRTILTGETSESDLNYLKGNDIMKGTNLSRLNTIAEKIHAVFADIYTLVKSTASIIFDTIKETFNGNHKTLLDVIKDTLEKVSRFIAENHDAIVEILAALLELQATIIEAVVKVILDIAKWIVDHKDLVVSVLNKIKDIVEWLGNHTEVVVAFVAALAGLKVIATITTLVGSFTTALGTLKTALNIGGAASAAGGAASGGAGAAGAAGAAGGAGVAKAGLGTKLLLNPYTWGIALTGLSSYEYNRENEEAINKYTADPVEAAEIALRKSNGARTYKDVTLTDTSGFFGIFKSMKDFYIDSFNQQYGLQPEDINKQANATAEKVSKILRDENVESLTSKQFDDLVNAFYTNTYKEVENGHITEEQLNSATEYFRVVLNEALTKKITQDKKLESTISELARENKKQTTLDDVIKNGPVASIPDDKGLSLDEIIYGTSKSGKDQINRMMTEPINRLKDISLEVNNKITEAVNTVNKSSTESQSKIASTLMTSMNTMNETTKSVESSFGTIDHGVNKATNAVNTFIGNAINGVNNLRSNVSSLSTDVQLLNNDTNNALSAIRSALSTASSAMYSAISGVMGTVSSIVGIPSVRNIFGFANGGAPKSGQMFIAREDGMPELVGNFGGYSGVANNDMIVRAMHDAIYDGMRAAGAGSTTYGRNGGTVNFNNYGYFGGDRASFRQFAEMINNANKSSDSNIANRSFRS